MDKLFMSNWIPVGNINAVEAGRWLLENTGKEHEAWYMTGGMLISGWMIDKSEDAVAFKLRFGNGEDRTNEL
jgi:hypothetical protein